MLQGCYANFRESTTLKDAGSSETPLSRCADPSRGGCGFMGFLAIVTRKVYVT